MPLAASSPSASTQRTRAISFCSANSRTSGTWVRERNSSGWPLWPLRPNNFQSLSCIESVISSPFRKLNVDEHSLEAIAARPFGDTQALAGGRILVHQDQQPLFALVLDQCDMRQPAAERDAVALRLVMHPRGCRAGGEGESACEDQRTKARLNSLSPAGSRAGGGGTAGTHKTLTPIAP